MTDTTAATPSSRPGPATRRAANVLVISIGLLCVSLQGAGLEETLRFDRTAIGNGQWWLLLTGNFVHLGASHLFMNIAGLALVAALVWSRFGAVEWIGLVLVSSLGVGIGLYALNPEIGWYVGFSGTLHGLIMAGCIADLKVWPRSAALLIAGVVAKLAWEQIAGALPGSESVAGGSVVVDAHLYGAVTGLVAGILLVLAGRDLSAPAGSVAGAEPKKSPR